MRVLVVMAFMLSVFHSTLLGQQVPTEPRVRALGFGDVLFVTSGEEGPEGFELGQIVGHVIATLDERITFFGEASLTGRDSGYGIELERAIVRYDFTDGLKISAGRFHTPVGYWNTAYHHGAWLQTSVARPEMIKFGGRFVPAHFVGMLAEGNLPLPGLGLGYTLGVGNGRNANIARGGDDGDVNHRRAWTAAFRSRPVSLVGFEIGASAYIDRITTTTGDDADETILGVHFAWDRDAPELLVEYNRIAHDPLAGGPSTDSNAFYAQLAYRLGGNAAAFKPYVRIERVDTAADDPIFGPLDLGYEGILGGIRYDAGTFVALRMEVRSEERDMQERATSFVLQASFVLSGS